MGSKARDGSIALFDGYTNGVKTNRDSWAYNSSRKAVLGSMKTMISFYNKALEGSMDGDINDASRIGWSWVLRSRFDRGLTGAFSPAKTVVATYRRFDKRWMYYDGFFNENRYQMPKLFPEGNEKNLVIVIKQRWSGEGQIALIVDGVIDVQSDGGTQCFPIYLYDDAAQISTNDLFAEPAERGLRRRDAITDAGLAHFENSYPGEQISKQDLFYYVYGILHSRDYRERFADNLSKELPRIPAVKMAADFWAFSKAGRALADIHLSYETAELYPLAVESKSKLTDSEYRVEKMRFAKKKDSQTGKSVNDRSTVIYNPHITIKGIPEAAWDYVVNGKPALEWVMERQAVRTDKASGIVNDANDWAIETMGNPRYPLELFQRVVTVSMETQKIVNNLPSLDI
ncbi:type ISP restriction/modification enzyme [Halopseudomonas sp.]|uniref:type ISP restriction/modification enzyme n=1 Tax=Halopseudomonas sp. TaxID=2901191 RepID=UPI003FA528AC